MSDATSESCLIFRYKRQRSREFASGRIRRGGLAHGAQSFPNRRFAGFVSQLLRALEAPLKFSVELTLVIVVICEGGMNLPE